MKRLGLDLGSNSLGWAIYDDNESDFFTDAGVIVFDEGIKREKGSDSLETPAAERRKYRMARRLKFRRKLRKAHVLRLLIDNQMCPLQIQELAAWEKNGKYPIENLAFIDWLKSTPDSNPYSARKACVEGKVDANTLGRAIYHLAQRRGFKSTRKEAATVDEDNSIPDKNLGEVKGSIKALTQELEKREVTLGQYFYELFHSGQKVRKHYIGRVEHYLKEFDKIIDVQKLDARLAEAFRHALFSQRPLRSQKNLVGSCILEKSRTRCLISHPLFEEFRMLAFINNIRLVNGEEKVPLDENQRALACKSFFRKTPYFDFEVIRKTVFGKKTTVELNYPDKTSVSSCAISHQLNEIFGCSFLNWSHEGRSSTEKITTYNYQTVFDALTFYEDDVKLMEFATNRIGLDAEAAKKLVSIHVRDGFAAYSLYAIRKILPFLREGRILSQAVFLAKLPDVIGPSRFAENKARILADIDAITSDYQENKRAAYTNQNVAVIPLQRRLKTYLETHWGVGDDGWSKLYLHTEGSSYDSRTGAETLPIVNLGMIRNPLVQRSLTILRRLVNQLRKCGKIDENTVINIELARNVNNRNTRMAIEQYQKEIEETRQNAIAHIQELNVPNPTEDQILKYLLCEEQGWRCLYTGRQISASDLLNTSTPFDIEHTMPRSRSGDDSQMNKSVCDAQYNRETKKGRLPTECPNYDQIVINLKDWQKTVDDLKAQLLVDKRKAKNTPAENFEAKAKAVQKSIVTKLKLNYWRTKLRYFTMTAETIGAGFMNRQLVDTGIMSRHALDFLHSVYPKTYAVNGVATAWARKTWGIQGIYEPKSRINHTHHAIDAMVIAALDREAFNKICSRFKDDGKDCTELFGVDESMKPFCESVRIISEGIVVKHLARHTETKQTFRNSVQLAKARKLVDGTVLRKVKAGGSTVRGQLHKESFYGKIKNPNENGEMQFVIRKPINDTSTFSKEESFEKIVDPIVRKNIREQVAEYMAQGLKFKEALNRELWMKRPQDGNPGVRINKVRISTRIKEPHELRMHSHVSKNEYKNPYYVESGKDSNFAMAIYDQVRRSKSGIEKHQIKTVVINILDWAKNHKQENYVSPEKRGDLGVFVGYLYPGMHAIAYQASPDELKKLPPTEFTKRVYVITKFRSDDGRVTMRLHTEARDSDTLSNSLGKTSGESSIDFSTPHPLIILCPGYYSAHFLFEGIHFDVSIDGELSFRK